MTVKRILGTCAVTIVAVVSAAGVWLGGAGEAIAPEPAELTGDLRSTDPNYSTTAAAVYVNTRIATKVVKWYGTYPKPANVYAGQPCWPGTLYAPNITYKVIVVNGAYASCR
jgi:hypothetical protein